MSTPTSAEQIAAIQWVRRYADRCCMLAASDDAAIRATLALLTRMRDAEQAPATEHARKAMQSVGSKLRTVKP